MHVNFYFLFSIFIVFFICLFYCTEIFPHKRLYQLLYIYIFFFKFTFTFNENGILRESEIIFLERKWNF